MAIELQTLPTELQLEVLTYLDLPSLLTFAQTSKRNHSNAISVLTTLHLAVVPRRIHGVLAFLNASAGGYLDQPSLHQIAVPASLCSTEPQKRLSTRHSRTAPTLDPKTHRQNLIAAQNERAAQILATPSLANLHKLTLHTFSLSSSALASTIATCLPSLRHLTLNFHHPYIHEACLPARWWNVPDAGTPAWNALAGVGAENEAALQLRGLEVLEVSRAGLTSRQLREWIERNRGLRELRLKCVNGVDGEFVEALAAMLATETPTKRKRLRVLELEDCPNLKVMSDEDLKWIDVLVENGLEKLSLRGCSDVDADIVQQADKARWGLTKLSLRTRFNRHESDSLSDDEDVGGNSSSTNSTSNEGVVHQKLPVIRSGPQTLEVDPACL